MFDTLKMTALAALLGLTIGVAPMGFGQAQGADTAHISIKGNAFGTSRAVALSLNKSMIIDLPVDVKEVIVGQAGVAKAILRSKRRAILQGIGAGDTNIIFLDATGRQIVVLDIQVQAEKSPVADALEATLARILPGSNIKVETLSDKSVDGKTHYFLTGTVQTAQDKAVAESMAAQLSADAGGDGDAGSLIQVVGPQQVMLKVTVAEVQRNVAKQLGINLSGSFSVGALSGSFNGGIPDMASGGGSLNTPFGDSNFEIELRALETRGGLRTLAEPVLTAMSGQPAEFHAGGQLPYNRVVDGNVVTDFIPYGVDLTFTPVINSNGTITLQVDSSVSEPGSGGSINDRSAKTMVELGVGQTLSIAGMLSERSRQDIDRFPGLGDIPILGALFRSREYTSDRTELVFLVTPYYARAKANMPELPTDNMQFAGDAEAIFLGHIETIYGVGPDGMRGSYDGSVGFLLD
jgi:pilus assembly protein CpaC